MRITRAQEIGRAARINSAPAIGALAALGLSVVWVVLRTSVLHDWTHTFRPTLEYDSANAARTIWFALHPDALVQWQRVWLQAGSGRFIEPPILQTLTALTYFPGGVERPWTSAIFTSLAWLMAGALLWDVCRRLVGSLEASVGLAYFLFAPFAIAVSRSFQSDSLAMLGLVATAWFGVRNDVLASRRNLLVMAVLAGVAALVKPGPLILPIIGVVVATASERGSIWSDRQRRWRLAALIGLVALPALAYGTLFLQGQVHAKVIPSLLLTTDYYLGWARNVVHVVGWTALPLAAVGIWLTPRLWRLVAWFLAGYLVTSLAFTWHTMTHDYYQVPLLALAAIGLAAFAGAAVRTFRSSHPAIASLMFAGLLATGPIAYLTVPVDVFPASDAYEVDAPTFAAIGERLGRGNSVIGYSYNESFPLMYYSGLLVSPWPTSGDREFTHLQGIDSEDEQRLAAAMRDGIRYFIVTADLRGVDTVRAFLDPRAPLLCQTPRLWVYDLKNPTHLPPNERATAPAGPC